MLNLGNVDPSRKLLFHSEFGVFQLIGGDGGAMSLIPMNKAAADNHMEFAQLSGCKLGFKLFPFRPSACSSDVQLFLFDGMTRILWRKTFLRPTFSTEQLAKVSANDQTKYLNRAVRNGALDVLFEKLKSLECIPSDLFSLEGTNLVISVMFLSTLPESLERNVGSRPEFWQFLKSVICASTTPKLEVTRCALLWSSCPLLEHMTAECVKILLEDGTFLTHLVVGLDGIHATIRWSILTSILGSRKCKPYLKSTLLQVGGCTTHTGCTPSRELVYHQIIRQAETFKKKQLSEFTYIHCRSCLWIEPMSTASVKQIAYTCTVDAKRLLGKDNPDLAPNDDSKDEDFLSQIFRFETDFGRFSISVASPPSSVRPDGNYDVPLDVTSEDRSAFNNLVEFNQLLAIPFGMTLFPFLDVNHDPKVRCLSVMCRILMLKTFVCPTFSIGKLKKMKDGDQVKFIAGAVKNGALDILRAKMSTVRELPTDPLGPDTLTVVICLMFMAWLDPPQWRPLAQGVEFWHFAKSIVCSSPSPSIDPILEFTRDSMFYLTTLYRSEISDEDRRVLLEDGQFLNHLANGLDGEHALCRWTLISAHLGDARDLKQTCLTLVRGSDCSNHGCVPSDELLVRKILKQAKKLQKAGNLSSFWHKNCFGCTRYNDALYSTRSDGIEFLDKTFEVLTTLESSVAKKLEMNNVEAKMDSMSINGKGHIFHTELGVVRFCQGEDVGYPSVAPNSASQPVIAFIPMDSRAEDNLLPEFPILSNCHFNDGVFPYRTTIHDSQLTALGVLCNVLVLKIFMRPTFSLDELKNFKPGEEDKFISRALNNGALKLLLEKMDSVTEMPADPVGVEAQTVIICLMFIFQIPDEFKAGFCRRTEFWRFAKRLVCARPNPDAISETVRCLVLSTVCLCLPCASEEGARVLLADGQFLGHLVEDLAGGHILGRWKILSMLTGSERCRPYLKKALLRSISCSDHGCQASSKVLYERILEKFRVFMTTEDLSTFWNADCRMCFIKEKNTDGGVLHSVNSSLMDLRHLLNDGSGVRGKIEASMRIKPSMFCCSARDQTAQRVRDTAEGWEKLSRSKCSRPECTKTDSKTKKFLQCSACKLVWYCGVECQKKHWKCGHRTLCKQFREKKMNKNEK
eukprot:187279_1